MIYWVTWTSSYLWEITVDLTAIVAGSIHTSSGSHVIQMRPTQKALGIPSAVRFFASLHVFFHRALLDCAFRGDYL